MIIGIGVDIAEIARVDSLYEKFGERFARRILTADELIEYRRRKSSSSFLALRFAAKEAVAKACGTGIGAELGFHAMQIDNDTKGKPVLRFLDAAGPLVKRLQIGNCLISLSDEKHYVVAMAVLET
ncbi:MAG: holo-ACP synthase [Gammaproteobacteria bacterium]|jgi:holo-[acyl-carrier protein] synthase|nr:holo-ACP synthase [Gammaproteobacteria bacterium]